MTLHISVLEDVRRELETSQDITVRPVLTTLRHMKKKQLSALNLLCACNGRATFEDIWKVEYIINRERVWTKEALKSELEDFTKKEVITVDEGLLKFNGDDFDKVYAKYFAREIGVTLRFPDFPLEVYLDVRMRAHIQKIEGIETIGKVFLNSYTDLSTVFEEITNTIKDEGDVPDSQVRIFEDLFPVMLHFRDMESIPFIFLRVTSSLLNAQMCYYPAHPISTKQIGECLKKIEELKTNIREVGGDLVFETKNLAVVPPEILCKKIMSSSNDRLKHRVTVRLEIEMFNEYTVRKSIKGALFYANLLYNYFEDKGPEMCNNIGYVFMNSERLDEAAQSFERAIIGYKDEKDRALPNYNFGIVNAKRKNYKEALFNIESSIHQLTESGSKKAICSCLIVPKFINGGLLFEEVREEPDLIVVTIEAKKSLDLLLREQKG
jgi:tetratricopeptide (TPR) repeat protein